MLFDSGSDRSFVTAKAVKTLELGLVRCEQLVIKACGCNDTEDSKVGDVVELSFSSIQGENQIMIQCFVVKEIFSIPNLHVEQFKKNYDHLNMLWFPGVRSLEDALEIDVLIGADYLWHERVFKTKGAT